MFDRWIDLTTGAYTDSISGGPLTGTYGFDGQVLWTEDAKGVVLPQNGSISTLRIADAVFEGTGALYRNGHGGANISYLGMRQDHSKSYEALSFKLAAGDKAQREYWFDAGTSLLTRKTVTSGGETTTTEFSDNQSINGLMISHMVVATDETGSRTVEQITSAEADPPGLREHLLRPTSSVSDFSLAGGETVVPIDLIDEHIYVDVSLNGKGPFHFMFDTGGRNIIDPTVAYNVGAHSVGSARAGGIGKHTREVQFANIDRVSIGGATLSGQLFRIIELGPRTNYGMFGTTPKRELQGLIGYELPARFMVTIDYAGKKMTLRTSSPQTPAADGDIPITFDGSWPAVDCQLASVGGTCILDTGSFAILIGKPFVDAHPEVKPRWFTGAAFIPIMPMEGVVASGFGGLSRGQVGTLSSAQFGSQTLNAIPKTIFSSDEKGALADPYIAAIVGNPVWEHFAMTLDYPHGRMRLDPAGQKN